MPDMLSAVTNRFSETSRLGQETLLRFSRSYECFMKGMINVVTRQIELTRDLVGDGLQDLGLLTQARSPEALVHAELEILRRGAERATMAASQIGNAVQEVFAETVASINRGD